MTFDALCLGEMLIDLVPTVTGHGLAEATAFAKAPGGAPANVAVGLARLGRPSGFCGMLGDDAFGRFCRDVLVREGVDTSGLRFTAAARTPVAFVSLGADGEREFVIYHPGADQHFDAADLDRDLIERARLLHFGSIGLIGEPSRTATLAAVRHARAAGARIACDPNLRLALWPDAAAARTGMGLAIAAADIVKLSHDEVAFMSGSDDPEQGARFLWHDHMVLMAVTLGPAGCLALTPDLALPVPGFAVAAVDTTGAGDGFMAGLLAAVLEDPAALSEAETLRRACRFANAVGALTTTAYGAIPALPTRAAVEALLNAES
ncbi:MAG: fructokinase [Alphaproteobacteria bacterium]|jgi:fructokinase|nr:fructokinase [Alphaproteobacteria bacterium]